MGTTCGDSRPRLSVERSSTAHSTTPVILTEGARFSFEPRSAVEGLRVPQHRARLRKEFVHDYFRRTVRPPSVEDRRECKKRVKVKEGRFSAAPGLFQRYISAGTDRMSRSQKRLAQNGTKQPCASDDLPKYCNSLMDNEF